MIRLDALINALASDWQAYRLRKAANSARLKAEKAFAAYLDGAATDKGKRLHAQAERDAWRDLYCNGKPARRRATDKAAKS